MYYICDYCGSYREVKLMKKTIHPKCNCNGGNGSTFMSEITKQQYNSWKDNLERTRKAGKS
jgi:hypothetical protein